MSLRTLSACGLVALALLQPAVSAARSFAGPDFSEGVERAAPAVVNIRVSERRAGPADAAGQNEPGLDDFLRRFSLPVPSRPSPRPSPRAGETSAQPRSVGSGLVWTADGYILTCAHVVDEAQAVVVRLPDRREFAGRVVGVDRLSDVALLKVEASGLPIVRMGEPGQLRAGEWVMAIGSPFNLDNTVSAGIVSTQRRDMPDSFLPLIQTDVAINPGNAGGPLLNVRGEVVGINAQIYSRSGGYMGISFAIPIDDVLRVAEQLRAHGRVVRGRIGVYAGPVSPAGPQSSGATAPLGAQVHDVEADGPAEQAGVQAGDIIVAVDGQPLEHVADLQRRVAQLKPGSRTRLQVLRRGTPQELWIGVVEADTGKPARQKHTGSL